MNPPRRDAALLRFAIPGDITESDVLKTLNGSPGARGTSLAFSRYSTDWNWGRQWEGASPEQIKRAIETLRRDALRKLQKSVDEWIDSGLIEGGEAPEQRSYERAPRAYAGALAFWEQSQNVVERPAHLSPVLRLAPPYEDGDPEAIVWKARRVLFVMLFGELRNRIARCRYRACKRYFVLKGERRKEVYEHGLFCCSEHNRAESAVRSVEARRSAETRRLVELAAVEILRIRHKLPEPQLKQQLVEMLNKRIARDRNRTRNEIKINWITHHWKEIKTKGRTQPCQKLGTAFLSARETSTSATWTRRDGACNAKRTRPH